MFAFSCYEFSLRFVNVTLVNGITSIFFVHMVVRFRKHLAYCLIGVKCHFDAVVFQNSVIAVMKVINDLT